MAKNKDYKQTAENVIKMAQLMSQPIHLTTEKVKNTCRIGQGAECCIFLSEDFETPKPDDYICIKNVKTLMADFPLKGINMTEEERKMSVHDFMLKKVDEDVTVAKSTGGAEHGHEGCLHDNKEGGEES